MGLDVSEYTISLSGIRFRGRHGVSPSERSLPQDFMVALEVALPVGILPSSDRYQDVFDYDKLASLVVQECSRTSYRLLETLARKVIQKILAETPAARVTVSITKSRPPTSESVESVSVRLSGNRGR